MERWTDKVVLVTGASSGIGRSVVIELSKYPLKIVVLARRIVLLQELAYGLQSSAAKIYPVQCDLTSESDTQKAFEWIETTVGKGVSVLVNSAGVSFNTGLLDGQTEDWRNMFDLNVLAATVCCRETIKSMRKHSIDDGHVININSTAGYTMLPYPGQKVYNASKTALNFLTEGLRHELAHAGLKIKTTNVSSGKVISAAESVENKLKPVLSMKPESVASMVIVALSTPPDILIADLVVLSTGETLQAYPPPMI